MRLAFALLGPLILLATFGYGVSLDVENLTYAVFDHDRTRESRDLLENLAGSRYFAERPEIKGTAEIEQRLRSGELKLAIEIPANFGRNLLKGSKTEIAIWLDGAMPFRAETTRSYLDGLTQQYFSEQARRHFGRSAELTQVGIEARFRYNQAFKSVFAIVPSVITLLLIVIPAMLTAVGVVREKENGSIANFRSTPVTGIEFLIGKQIPYVVIAFASFLSLVVLARVLFGVGVKGSALALVVGGFIYVIASTGFGLLVSSFTKTQVAALFATVVITLVPAINFSGLLVPVSSLSGGARLFGLSFPAAWFEQISVGTFTKALGFAQLWQDHLVVAGFAVVFMTAAVLAMRNRKPEMRPVLDNTLRLGIKELRSLRADPIMLVLIITFSPTWSTRSRRESISKSSTPPLALWTKTAHNSRDGSVWQFWSPISRSPVELAADQIDKALNSGDLVFVVEIPPRFEQDVLSGRRPSLQIDIDATALTQAGNGAVYLQEIIAKETQGFAQDEKPPSPPRSISSSAPSSTRT